MHLTGIHFMLTWQCNYECDHCFVWGSPRQSGTWRLADLRSVLEQAEELGTVDSIYFEGGEPFLYYPLLVAAVWEAAGRGFDVGLVTNAYWATGLEEAFMWLKPMAGAVDDLSVSSDFYHVDEEFHRQAHTAILAAAELDIPTGLIRVAQPRSQANRESELMYRGRAAVRLAPAADQHPWETFDACRYEDLREPGRLHVDPLGNLFVCQGISIGNVLQQPLAEILAAYRPDIHPIAGPLLHGGPAELARRYDVPTQAAYADACHLCYSTRLALRERFPEILAPDGMYGSP